MSKKVPRVPGTSQAQQEAYRRACSADYRQTAVHEAAHVVVGHALGRQPAYARIKPKRLAVGDPTNPLPISFTSFGYTTYYPEMADEIELAHQEGLPLTEAQKIWLLQGIPISLAGQLTEPPNTAHVPTTDHMQIALVAAVLGVVTTQFGALVKEAAVICQTIFEDREEDRAAVRDALLSVGELQGPDLAGLLSEPLGSHADLLEKLDQFTA